MMEICGDELERCVPVGRVLCVLRVCVGWRGQAHAPVRRERGLVRAWV